MFMVYSMEDIFIAMVLMTEILICNGELPTSEKTVKPSELNIDIMFTLWLLGSHLYWWLSRKLTFWAILKYVSCYYSQR